MLFVRLDQDIEGSKMSENSCKVVIREGKETTASQAVFSTTDVDLHIFMLTYQV